MVSFHGRFVWYELMTTDAEAAAAFYSKVVDWGTLDASLPGMTYGLFTVGEASVSGLMALPEAARKAGAKPRWTGYVGVDDVDATAERVRQLGGAVQVPPTDIPGISRFSVVADPQMATLALVKWLRPRQELSAARNAPGQVGWHELVTADVERALAYYGALFGWQKGDADVDPMGTYQLFSAGAQTIGGMFNRTPAEAGAFWLYSFNVDDIDAASRRVQDGGGQIVDGPFEVPGASWVAQCIDPQGAIFALVGKRPRKPIGYFERLPRDPSDTRRRRWSW